MGMSARSRIKQALESGTIYDCRKTPTSSAPIPWVYARILFPSASELLSRSRLMSLIPLGELKMLRLTVTEAHQLARGGDPREGWSRLMGGKRRLAGEPTHERPWAADLLRRYDDALAAFSLLWGDDGSPQAATVGASRLGSA
jgi:hypothetical protein